MATATAAAAAHTPMINKDSYVTASFIDNDRKTLEVLVRHHENKNEMTPLIIEASEDQQDFKDLMEFVTMDQLHEQTWENKKAESEAFIAMAKNIAKDAFSEAEAVANVAVDEAEIFSRTNRVTSLYSKLLRKEIGGSIHHLRGFLD